MSRKKTKPPKTGLDDAIRERGPGAVEGLPDVETAPDKIDFSVLMEVMRGTWGIRDEAIGSGELEFNELLKLPTLDRKELNPDHVTPKFREAAAKRQEWRCSEPDVHSALVAVAREKSFHPVRDYLSNLKWDGKDRFEELASDVLQLAAAKEDLSRVLLRKFLIAAVARAMTPGCKVDTVLILVGKGGLQKSTFFETLAGPEYFSDTNITIGTKDGLLALHQTWFYEWPELDSMRRAEVSTVKAFLSSRSDMVRPPYGRTTERMLRACVVVGTTNEARFLTDHTGNRRFWPVAVPDYIDLARLRAIRDQVWAEAVALYRKNEQWWLSPKQEEELARRNEEHRDVDVVEDEVVQFVEESKPRGVTSDAILAKLFSIGDRSKSNTEGARVRRILEPKGYEYKKWGGDPKNRGPRLWRHESWGRATVTPITEAKKGRYAKLS